MIIHNFSIKTVLKSIVCKVYVNCRLKHFLNNVSHGEKKLNSDDLEVTFPLSLENI